MTYALCFNCGKTKFGALVACSECGCPASGDPNLDIAFSDHILSTASIEAFGNVIQAIQKESEDSELNFWAFIRYVSLHYPSVLHVELPEYHASACDNLLSRLTLTEFKLIRSKASQRFIDQQAQNGKRGRDFIDRYAWKKGFRAMYKSIVLLTLCFFGFIVWIIVQADTNTSNVFISFTKSFPYGDKLGHIGLFGLLTLASVISTKFHTITWGSFTIYTGSAIVLVFVVGEEISQAFFPSRTFDLIDLVADLVGIGAAVFLASKAKKIILKSEHSN